VTLCRNEIAEKIGINRVSLARRLNKQLPLIELNEICHYLGRDATEFVETYQTTDEEMQERREERDKLKKARKLGEKSKKSG